MQHTRDLKSRREMWQDCNKGVHANSKRTVLMIIGCQSLYLGRFLGLPLLTSLVSFTGSYTEDKLNNFKLTKRKALYRFHKVKKKVIKLSEGFSSLINFPHPKRFRYDGFSFMSP